MAKRINWEFIGVFFASMIIFFFMLAFCTSNLNGQVTLTDTVFITIEGDLATTELTALLVQPTQIGDTIEITALARDSEEDPVSARHTFYTSDSTAIRLEMVPLDSLNLSEAKVRAIALKKANAYVWVITQEMDRLLLASFRPPDSLNWSGHDTIFTPLDSLGRVINPDDPRSKLQYCAYLIDSKLNLVAESPGPPACPIVFLPEALPADWAPLSRLAARNRRIKDFRHLYALRTSLRGITN